MTIGLFLGCLVVALAIASIFKKVDGDDGQKWPHPGASDTHRWK